MSKPSWDRAPEECNFMAMDGDGVWGWYQREPWWDEEEGQWQPEYDNDYVQASERRDESGIDWDFAYTTLERRP